MCSWLESLRNVQKFTTELFYVKMVYFECNCVAALCTCIQASLVMFVIIMWFITYLSSSAVLFRIALLHVNIIFMFIMTFHIDIVRSLELLTAEKIYRS